MNYEQEIEQLNNEVKRLQKIIEDISSSVNTLNGKVNTHQHLGIDGTEQLNNSLKLKDESFITIGGSGIAARTNDNVKYFYISAGFDKNQGFSTTTENTQLNIEHQEATTGSTNQTFFYGFRPPVYTTNGVVSITSGTATLTDSTKSWDTDELAGAYVNIYDSNNTLKDVRVISSNTSTQITVSTNWTFTDASSKYIVFVPVYLGSADYPWRRVYTGEGAGEGVRFGYGATNAGQNGMLYMDAAGDLYWRNKSGTSTKLN